MYPIYIYIHERNFRGGRWGSIPPENIVGGDIPLNKLLPNKLFNIFNSE